MFGAHFCFRLSFQASPVPAFKWFWGPLARCAKLHKMWVFVHTVFCASSRPPRLKMHSVSGPLFSNQQVPNGKRGRQVSPPTELPMYLHTHPKSQNFFLVDMLTGPKWLSPDLQIVRRHDGRATAGYWGWFCCGWPMLAPLILLSCPERTQPGYLLVAILGFPGRVPRATPTLTLAPGSLPADIFQ